MQPFLSLHLLKAYLASAIGAIAARPLLEAVAEEFGWEGIFYVAGSTTLYWFMLWSGLAFDAPEMHPRIGFREKKLVPMLRSKSVLLLPFGLNASKELAAHEDTIIRLFSIPRRILRATKSVDVCSPPPRTLRSFFRVPLLPLLSSLPLLGAVAAECADAWGFYTLRRYGPLYVRFVLGVDIALGGVLAAIPLICRCSAFLRKLKGFRLLSNPTSTAEISQPFSKDLYAR